MKRVLFAAIAACGLTACMATTDDAGSDMSTARQLATQADLDAVIGKTLTLNPGQSFVVSADGSMIGVWDGAPLVGTYEMRDGYFCRVLTEFVQGPLPEDCQLWILDGDNLTGTRDRGEGASFTYTIS